MNILKKNKYLIIALALIASFIIFVLVSFIGSFSLSLKIVVGTLIYFFFTLYFLKSNFQKNKWLCLYLVILPLLISIFYFSIFQFKATWISVPSQFFLLLSSLASFAFYKRKSFIIPIILTGLVFFWVSWLHKLYKYEFIFNSLTGNVSFPFPHTKIYDSSGSVAYLNQKEKIYILDFWGSSCAPCFRQFPTIDKINKIADSKKFEIITLNIPLPTEKKEDNYNLLAKFNYGFKKLYAENANTADSFGITGFPTTIVVKNSEVIFRGEFDDAVKPFNVKP